jgi:2-polyprenyl-6-methoxyphenol hydroxylase-like FAD-dependent oxidoreductase
VWNVAQGRERRGAIVGGSIAGCAMAIACGHAGLSVEVYERSGDELAERGLGIAMPVTLHARLVEAGYLDAAMPVHEVRDRMWIVRDLARPYAERELIRSQTPAIGLSWNLLWRSLRDQVPDSAYHAGERVELDGEELRLSYNGASGTTRPFDLLIGADGSNSAIRQLVSPDTELRHAGYSVWRARLALDKLSGPVEALRETGVTVMFPGGHGIYYLIPDAEGRLVVNWLVYTRIPESSSDESSSYDSTHTYLPGTAPELVGFIKDLTGAEMPPAWAEVVSQTPDEEIAVFPVYDLEVERYARGTVLLAGDAGAVTRPHTGSGAVKALGDALSLERMLLEEQSGDLLAVAERYNRDRLVDGNGLCLLGRRLGRTHVEEVPDFSLMGDADVQAWLEAPFKGEDSYIFRGRAGSGDGGRQAVR